MQSKTNNHWISDIFVLGIIIFAFYLLWLGSYPLFTPDEARYSEVAREMVASGDYLTPRVNGIAFLDKPILYYWLQATAIRLFGIHEWALRLFPTLFGVFGCLATYAAGRHLFSRRTGLLSAIILATTPLYFGGAHYADLNLEVAVLISTSLLCFITATVHAGLTRSSLFISAYLFAALAFLTKGLIGIAFPIMIIGSWIIILSRWTLLLNMRLMTGMLLFAIIVTPWFYLAQQANPIFMHYFFITQQFTRFLSGADFNNKEPLWFYLPVILAGFIPWTLFIIQAMIKSIRNILTACNAHSAELFLILWVMIIFAFFSIPTSKLVGYIFPIFPALALLTGRYIDTVWERAPKNMRVIFSSCTSMAVLLLMFVIANANYHQQDSLKPMIMQLKKTIKPEDTVATYLQYYQEVPIYLERRVAIVGDWQNNDIANQDNWEREFWYGKDMQDTTGLLINEHTFWQQWHSNKRMYVFLRSRDLARFAKYAKNYHLIAKQSDVLLLGN